jgi:hypothetical protein
MVSRETGDAVPTAGQDPVRRAEAALRRLGFARIPPAARDVPGNPAFWVQEAGVPRRTFPVFVSANRPGAADRPVDRSSPSPPTDPAPARAIVVVPTEVAAEEAWQSLRRNRPGSQLSEVSILVNPPATASAGEPRWHAGTLPPRELLSLATGVVVGLFRRAAAEEGAAQVDFSELLTTLRQRFGVDVHRSLGVGSDEDALFILYQLALRDSYAPGDPGANLHVLVLKPTGPAARLPWFAA